MSWLSVLFWTGVFALCIYIIIEIQNGKTSYEKITHIRGEMQRLEQIDQLNADAEVFRKRIHDHLKQMRVKMIAAYNNGVAFLMDLRERTIQLIVDIITPRLYSIIG
jgi:hypothetical protein